MSGSIEYIRNRIPLFYIGMLTIQKPLKYLSRQLLLLCLVLSPLMSRSQTQQRYNRFQYHSFHWRSFHTKSFHIYFPAGCDSLCAFVARAFPDVQEQVKKAMTSSSQKVPSIIIYPSVDQLYESNIGSFEPREYTLPTFVSKGDRLLLFYNGSYNDLMAQLQEAIVRSIWEAQFRTDDIAGQAKSAVKDDPIPMWFREGTIRYFAHSWPVEAEDALKISFEQNHFNNWQDVIDYQPRLSGQAFCYFLADKYFRQAPASLYSLLRKKKQLPRALRLVVKEPIDSVFNECFDYYQQRFSNNTAQNLTKPASSLAITHKKGIIKTVQLSPDKQYVAYVLNTYNKRTVYCYDNKAKTTAKIATYLLPPWIGDHSADIYPLLEWADKGKSLQVTQPVAGKLTIRSYNPAGGEIAHTLLYGVDGVSTVTKTDYRQYLMAAYRHGQSDIVSYNENKEKYTAFTMDIYEDALPVLTANGKLTFVSDRPLKGGKRTDTLKLAQGLYTLDDNKPTPLKADSISFVKWDKPFVLQDGRILTTNTNYGTERFSLLSMAVATPLKDYCPLQYIPQSDEVSVFENKKDTLTVENEPLQRWLADNTAAPGDTSSAWLHDYRKRAAEQAKEDSILKRAKDNNPSLLEDVFFSKESKSKGQRTKDSIRHSQEYDAKKVKPYILQLHSAYFTAQVNNDYFINRYQPYFNYQGQFKFPEVGGMVQGGLTDLFENHHFKISYRLPAGSEGSDFFIHYSNTAKKVDWGLTYFRKVESLKPDPNRNWVDEFGKPYPNVAKVKTFYYDASLHHPLSYDCSLGLQEAVRIDRTVFLATDRYGLEFNDLKSTWSITTLSGDLNKLKPTVPNLYKGFKGNAAIDVFKGLSQGDALVLGSTAHLEYNQPLYRYITLVLQAHGGYSVGDKKVLYTLGGVDNNVTPKVDSTVHFSQTAPYAFQSIVTPFRGYLQNSSYGNQYLLLNADLYFPIFQTLIPIETALPSLNDLQLGLFYDMANAKETWENNLNNAKWLYSYGLSARTKLAGYPLRFDIAWPGTFSRKPIWYLSLSL
jgi:hypothetical protein